MWYFTWILGLGLALAFGIINVMWLEASYFSGELDEERVRKRFQRGGGPIDLRTRDEEAGPPLKRYVGVKPIVRIIVSASSRTPRWSTRSRLRCWWPARGNSRSRFSSGLAPHTH